jgi:tetratricopeptide (TPR) repeat protein
VLTSLIRFVFISFLLSSAAVFSAEDISNSPEPSASKVAPQPTSNSQLPEWFYRELTLIRKDVSVLDATGASKEQIQELKERIEKVEVRLEESQLRVDGKLNEQNGRIGDIHSFVSQMGWLIGIVVTIVTGLAVFFNINAKRESISSAKEEAKRATDEWIHDTEREIIDKFEDEISTLGIRFDAELKDVRENAELQTIKTMINRALSMAEGFGQRYNEAVEELNDAINKYANYGDAEIQEQVVFAYVLKGEILGAMKRSNDAITVFDYVIAKFTKSGNSTIKHQVESAFTNKVEQLFVTGQNQILKETMKQTSDHISQDSVYFSIVELFKFIVGESDSNTVYNHIAQLPRDINITWSFNLIRTEVSKLQPPVKDQATAFIKFFEEHKDKVKLKEELDQIPII